MALDIKTRTQEWIEENPLRVWRKSQKNAEGKSLSMRELASIIGVNLMSVQGWEVGNSFPSPGNMASIVQLTKDPGIVQRWYEWNAKGPNR